MSLKTVTILQKYSEVLKNVLDKHYSPSKKKNKTDARWDSHGTSSSILLMQGAKLLFITHFLISPIYYGGSTLINFGFFIKEDFR